MNYDKAIKLTWEAFMYYEVTNEWFPEGTPINVTLQDAVYQQTWVHAGTAIHVSVLGINPSSGREILT